MACWSDFEDSATAKIGGAIVAVLRRRPVKISVSGLYQACHGTKAILARRRGTEHVQRPQLALRSHFEDGATTLEPAAIRGPIEIPVGGLNQASLWFTRITDVERVQRG